MTETFGDRLRKQRELRGVGLTAIAEDTKISVGLLEALEHNDLSHWPTGIFRRSFVRSYARAVGLDPEATIREFIENFPEPVSGTELPGAERVLAADRNEPDHANGSGARSRLGSMFHALTANRNTNERPSLGHLAPAPMPAPPSPVEAAESVHEQESAPAVASQVDIAALATLCTTLAATHCVEETVTLLDALAPTLGALGTIVWQACPERARLAPVAAAGYSPSLLARIPDVPCDSDNATAAAYRSASTCVVTGNDRANGALAVPILGTAGCVGVLAMELGAGAERDQRVQAAAAIIAAQLSHVVAPLRLAVDDRKFA